jgi:hypothetical protein
MTGNLKFLIEYYIYLLEQLLKHLIIPFSAWLQQQMILQHTPNFQIIYPKFQSTFSPKI